MNCYVISLETATDRRNTLEERLNRGGIYDYEIWNATGPDLFNDSEIYKITGREWKQDPRLKNVRKSDSRKACYLSHLLLMKHLIDKGINEALILEDDIEFTADITDILYRQPKNSLVSFLDTTHIEKRGGYTNPTWVDENWLLLNNCSGIRCWCAGAYYITDITKVYYNLIVNPPKVYDKCLIDYIQKDFKTYLYFTVERIAKQDRRSYESSIK